MKEITLLDGQIIRYELTRKRVKNINFRVAPDGVIRISANSRVSEKYIIGYMQAHSEEFLHAIERTLMRQSRINSDSTIVRWLGKEYPVELINDGGEYVELLSDAICLHTLSESEDDRLVLIEQWRIQAFMQLVRELNDEVRSTLEADGRIAPHTVITVKDLKSRWGSCSYNKGRITLNYRLAAFPRQTILGVLWHEYTHYWHHDHQKGFYSQLLYYYPEYYKWDALLK